MTHPRLVLLIVGMLAAFAPQMPASADPSLPKKSEGRVVQLSSYPLPDGVIPNEMGSGRGSVKSGSRCPSQVRASKDRPDPSREPKVHLIYLLPKGEKDRRFDSQGTLSCSMLAQNQWFREQSDGLQWRLDLYSSPSGKRVDVTFVRSAQKAKDLIDVFSIEDDLTRQGFSQANKRYLVYVESDGDGACGMGASPIDVSSEPVDGQYAAVFLQSPPACGATHFGVPGAPSFSEAIAQQELIHADGVVPIGAPHTCQLDLGLGFGHICTGPLGITDGADVTSLDPERIDVMFPFINLPLSQQVLDRDDDDYFGHSLPLRDLANGIYLVPTN